MLSHKGSVYLCHIFSLPLQKGCACFCHIFCLLSTMWHYHRKVVSVSVTFSLYHAVLPQKGHVCLCHISCLPCNTTTERLCLSLPHFLSTMQCYHRKVVSASVTVSVYHATLPQKGCVCHCHIFCLPCGFITERLCLSLSHFLLTMRHYYRKVVSVSVTLRDTQKQTRV